MNASPPLQPYVILLGRTLLGLIFAISGLLKIAGFSGVAGYMGSKGGLPFPEVLLVLTIIVEVGGGFALILGWQARLAALALFFFVIAASLVFHQFWGADAAAYQNQFNHFMKNLSIMGGMLYVFAFGPGPLSIDERGRAAS